MFRHTSKHFFTNTRLMRARSLHSQSGPTRLTLCISAGATAGAVFILYNLRTLYLDSDHGSQFGRELVRPVVGLGHQDIQRAFGLAPTAKSIEDLLRRGCIQRINDPPLHGVSRMYHAIINSNDPGEDFLSSSSVNEKLPWTFFGVYDGHNGISTSNILGRHLIEAVLLGLADLYSKYNYFAFDEMPRNDPPPEAIDTSIKDTFKETDDLICNASVEKAISIGSKPVSVALLAPAFSGSCAVLGFYDYNTRLLRVALTGDSRAILGRRIRDASGRESFEVHVLSQDQNGKNSDEQARLNALHPGEKIFEKGRTLGWGISRAFGDAKYKWSRETQEALRTAHLGGSIPSDVKTPPYFTAEPEITTTEVQPGDFVVLASDGLWDCLTNEEVMGLVGMWMNQQHKGEDGGITRDELPTKMREDNTVMYRYWGAKKKFLNVDENAALHLARNALGGADKDLTAALLGMQAPRARKFRDDIAAIVVFFDDEQGNTFGASTSSSPVRPH